MLRSQASRARSQRGESWSWTIVFLGCLCGCGPQVEPGINAAKKAPVLAGSNANNTPGQADPTAPTASDVAAADPASRRVALYAQHCVACHGEKGDGQGIAAKFVFPKPRDFRAGRFRLVSTTNGLPSIADIEAVLVRGMPGSAMLPWEQLSEADRKLLAEQVLELRRQGARDTELALAAESGDELTEQQLKEAVDLATQPGELFETPRFGEADAAAIERGREIYLTKGCAACHGNSGKGDGQQVMVDAEGLPTRPRDLTRGIFKGKSDAVSIYQRIWLGMPGTPMPSSQGLTHEQVADLVHYIRSLSDEPTRQAAVLKRQRLRAIYLSPLLISTDAEAWNGIEATPISMVPLWWRDDPDPGLTVRAAHDGTSLILQLSWRDATPNRATTRSESFKDAAAVELYRGAPEPFVGMGALVAPVDVWMWDADRNHPTDIEDANPNLAVDVYPFTESHVETAEYRRPGTKTADQAQLALPAKAVGNLITPVGAGSGGTAMAANGPGSMTFRLPTNQYVDAQGEWRDGRWTVVLRRPLQLSEGMSLVPGEHVSVAFAVWDGSHNDRDGQKLITIWQDLELEELKKQ